MDDVFDIPDPEEIDPQTAKALFPLLLRTLEAQTRTIEGLSQEIAELKRALFGQKSERVVPVDREISKRKRQQETPEEKAARQKKSKKKRNQTREKRRSELPTEVVEHNIVEDACQNCGAPLKDADVLTDDVSEEFEYVPAKVIRREHRRERKVCGCGCFAIAPAPDRVVEGGLYGPGLHAHVAVAKCADSIPLDRQARAFKRAGTPLAKATLCNLFHRNAELLSPIVNHMFSGVKRSDHVNADETSLKVQAKGECERAFVWTFIATHATHSIVTYRFSADRSSETPVDVLSGGNGTLQVDGYSGYNEVTRLPDSWDRVGCWAHARRKLFDALESQPDRAQEGIDMIRQLYEVEWEAAEGDFLGTKKHLAMRQAVSKKVVEEIFDWVKTHRPSYRPKSKIGTAFTYLTNQKETLERFLDDAKIPADNNVAERALRLIALGRKNFLFVGNHEAGENLAVLQSLISTCLVNDVNPQDYITDVLMRVQTTPQSEIDSLMPWNWEPAA